MERPNIDFIPTASLELLNTMLVRMEVLDKEERVEQKSKDEFFQPVVTFQELHQCECLFEMDGIFIGGYQHDDKRINLRIPPLYLEEVLRERKSYYQEIQNYINQ